MSSRNTWLCLIAAWLRSGCVALHEHGEAQWQALHAVDTIQTFHLTHDPRYKEVESAWLIGEYPSDTTVLAWSVGFAMMHAGVTQWLIENDHDKLSKAWQYLTLTSVCNTVGNNAAIGIRIGAPNAGPDPEFRLDLAHKNFASQSK
jgi:hypothetical protein